MPLPKANVYDAIIIVAGIGGLACGFHPAKAGRRVLFAEQYCGPAGCCTSFKKLHGQKTR